MPIASDARVTPASRPLLVGDSLVERCHVAPATRFRRHEHDTLHLCGVLDGGFAEQRRRAEGNGYEAVTAGTIRVSPPAKHSIDFGPQGAVCVIIELGKSITLDAFGPRARPATVAFVQDRYASSLITALATQIGQRGVQLFEAEDTLTKLVAQLTRRSSSPPLGPPPGWLRTAREMLHAEPTRPTPEIAATAGVRRVHLARAFRDHFGMSMRHYAQQLRVRRVRELLERLPEVPLAEIACVLGYADQNHLTRDIRRACGAPPGHLRRHLRRNVTNVQDQELPPP